MSKSWDSDMNPPRSSFNANFPAEPNTIHIERSINIDLDNKPNASHTASYENEYKCCNCDNIKIDLKINVDKGQSCSICSSKRRPVRTTYGPESAAPETTTNRKVNFGPTSTTYYDSSEDPTSPTPYHGAELNRSDTMTPTDHKNFFHRSSIEYPVNRYRNTANTASTLPATVHHDTPTGRTWRFSTDSDRTDKGWNQQYSAGRFSRDPSSDTDAAPYKDRDNHMNVVPKATATPVHYATVSVPAPAVSMVVSTDAPYTAIRRDSQLLPTEPLSTIDEEVCRVVYTKAPYDTVGGDESSYSGMGDNTKRRSSSTGYIKRPAPPVPIPPPPPLTDLSNRKDSDAKTLPQASIEDTSKPWTTPIQQKYQEQTSPMYSSRYDHDIKPSRRDRGPNVPRWLKHNSLRGSRTHSSEIEPTTPKRPAPRRPDVLTSSDTSDSSFGIDKWTTVGPFSLDPPQVPVTIHMWHNRGPSPITASSVSRPTTTSSSSAPRPSIRRRDHLPDLMIIDHSKPKDDSESNRKKVTWPSPTESSKPTHTRQSSYQPFSPRHHYTSTSSAPMSQIEELDVILNKRDPQFSSSNEFFVAEEDVYDPEIACADLPSRSSISIEPPVSPLTYFDLTRPVNRHDSYSPRTSNAGKQTQFFGKQDKSFDHIVTSFSGPASRGSHSTRETINLDEIRCPIIHSSNADAVCLACDRRQSKDAWEPSEPPPRYASVKSSSLSNVNIGKRASDRDFDDPLPTSHIETLSHSDVSANSYGYPKQNSKFDDNGGSTNRSSYPSTYIMTHRDSVSQSQKIRGIESPHARDQYCKDGDPSSKYPKTVHGTAKAEVISASRPPKYFLADLTMEIDKFEIDDSLKEAKRHASSGKSQGGVGENTERGKPRYNDKDSRPTGERPYNFSARYKGNFKEADPEMIRDYDKMYSDKRIDAADQSFDREYNRISQAQKRFSASDMKIGHEGNGRSFSNRAADSSDSVPESEWQMMDLKLYDPTGYTTSDTLPRNDESYGGPTMVRIADLDPGTLGAKDQASLPYMALEELIDSLRGVPKSSYDQIASQLAYSSDPGIRTTRNSNSGFEDELNPTIYSPKMADLKEAQQDPKEVLQIMDKHPVYLTCGNCGLRKEIQEAANFRSCQLCFIFYCSEKCRTLAWPHHRNHCDYRRIYFLCRAILLMARSHPLMQYEISCFARPSYAHEGRGVVDIHFNDRFVAHSLVSQPNGYDLISRNHGTDGSWYHQYIPIRDLQTLKSDSKLVDLCRSYDPHSRYILSATVLLDIGPNPPVSPPNSSGLNRRLSWMFPRTGSLKQRDVEKSFDNSFVGSKMEGSENSPYQLNKIRPRAPIYGQNYDNYEIGTLEHSLGSSPDGSKRYYPAGSTIDEANSQTVTFRNPDTAIHPRSNESGTISILPSPQGSFSTNTDNKRYGVRRRTSDHGEGMQPWMMPRQRDRQPKMDKIYKLEGKVEGSLAQLILRSLDNKSESKSKEKKSKKIKK